MCAPLPHGIAFLESDSSTVKAAARGQTTFDAPQTEALSAAAKASPGFVTGLATELGSTPEQAAGAAGVLFTIAKALLEPEDFAQVEKAVPTAQNWIGSAIAGFMKMGIKPDMIAKAVPYLSGYLKKHGTAGLGSLIGGVLKTPK
jgi:hypothetical protein